MTFARPVLFVLLAASLVGFRADDTYALRHKVAKDEAVTFSFLMHVIGEGTDVRFEGKSKTKIVTVEEDGAYEAEVIMLEGKINANGVETVMTESEPQKVKYNKDGTPAKKEDDGIDGPLNVNMVLSDLATYEPGKPVKMGETWTKDGKYGEVTFKLEGKEKVRGHECLKIGITAKLNKREMDGAASGAYYLHADDFSVEKSEFKIENGSNIVESKMEQVD